MCQLSLIPAYSVLGLSGFKRSWYTFVLRQSGPKCPELSFIFNRRKKLSKLGQNFSFLGELFLGSGR